MIGAVGVLQGLPVAEVNVTAGSNTHLKLRGQKFDMLLELMDDSIATKVGFIFAFNFGEFVVHFFQYCCCMHPCRTGPHITSITQGTAKQVLLTHIVFISKSLCGMFSANHVLSSQLCP